MFERFEVVSLKKAKQVKKLNLLSCHTIIEIPFVVLR